MISNIYKNITHYGPEQRRKDARRCAECLICQGYSVDQDGLETCIGSWARNTTGDLSSELFRWAERGGPMNHEVRQGLKTLRMQAELAIAMREVLEDGRLFEKHVWQNLDQ